MSLEGKIVTLEITGDGYNEDSTEENSVDDWFVIEDRDNELVIEHSRIVCGSCIVRKNLVKVLHVEDDV